MLFEKRNKEKNWKSKIDSSYMEKAKSPLWLEANGMENG